MGDRCSGFGHCAAILILCSTRELPLTGAADSGDAGPLRGIEVKRGGADWTGRHRLLLPVVFVWRLHGTTLRRGGPWRWRGPSPRRRSARSDCRCMRRFRGRSSGALVRRPLRPLGIPVVDRVVRGHARDQGDWLVVPRQAVSSTAAQGTTMERTIATLALLDSPNTLT